MKNNYTCGICKQQFQYIVVVETIDKFIKYKIPEYRLGCECMKNGSDTVTHRTTVWVYYALRDYEQTCVRRGNSV